jgi:1-acyl-sn-glycerol-3-phosphate acyltransferase
MAHRLLHTALTASAFFFFFLVGTFLSYVVLPLSHLAGGSRPERARRCRRIVGRAWVLFHDYMRVVRLIQYDPRRAALALPPGPFVMVANHPTLVDVTALVSAHPDLTFVAKTAMFRSPLVGRVLRHCDHIESGDGTAFSGAAVVDQALTRLRQGTPVLVFPEGTRSPEHGLGDFRSGAFLVAAQAGVPIVPVLVTCEPPTLMRGQPWYAIPKRLAVMTLTQLPVLPPPHEDPREGARALRAVYAQQLEARRAPAGAMETQPLVSPGSVAR